MSTRARKTGPGYAFTHSAQIMKYFWNKIRIRDKKEMADELSFVDK